MVGNAQHGKDIVSLLPKSTTQLICSIQSNIFDDVIRSSAMPTCVHRLSWIICSNEAIRGATMEMAQARCLWVVWPCYALSLFASISIVDFYSIYNYNVEILPKYVCSRRRVLSFEKSNRVGGWNTTRAFEEDRLLRRVDGADIPKWSAGIWEALCNNKYYMWTETMASIRCSISVSSRSRSRSISLLPVSQLKLDQLYL